MKKVDQDSTFEWLINTYFSNPNAHISLRRGEILIKQGQYNNRLYLVINGVLQGYMEDGQGGREETLRAGQNSFVGVYSFFSRTFTSIATVEALEDSEVAYIDSHEAVIPSDLGTSLEEQFMPVVVADLMLRQQRMLELGQEKEQALKQLLENQKLASLGQMAAGIAHEINNAVAVLARNTNWLVEQFSADYIPSAALPVFETGLARGRFFSSRDVRQRKKEIMEKFRLEAAQAQMLARTGFSDQAIESFRGEAALSVDSISKIWELGATFHDMLIASEQTTHVVKSMKAMGTQHKDRTADLDLNESIHNALSILRHKLKSVNVTLKLSAVPKIRGNLGEFVQVWMNLIKNSCEAMAQDNGQVAELIITSAIRGRWIEITIADNGSGIPEEILPNIFQPNVTTKVSGLSFGLGLGLTIVQRIINEYRGQIAVESSQNGTIFTLKIPHGGING